MLDPRLALLQTPYVQQLLQQAPAPIGPPATGTTILPGEQTLPGGMPGVGVTPMPAPIPPPAPIGPPATGTAPILPPEPPAPIGPPGSGTASALPPGVQRAPGLDGRVPPGLQGRDIPQRPASPTETPGAGNALRKATRPPKDRSARKATRPGPVIR